MIKKEVKMKYKALVINNIDGVGKLDYEELEKKPLSSGEVFIKVIYSGINYKDSLAINPTTKVVRNYPMVPGVDFSGEVVESLSPLFSEGDLVFLTGLGYGTDRFGGFQEYVTVKGEDLLSIPKGLTPKEVMVYGTAGLTAAMSVEALSIREHDIQPLPFLVTGGTGGVSSHAILILKKLGCGVVASTRNQENMTYLKELGADDVVLFDTLLEKRRPLSTEKYSGAIDATGGEAVGNLLTEIKYGGVIGLSGNLAGMKFQSTVFPFILRGVSLVGIDSVQIPMEKKKRLFEKLADQYKAEKLMEIVSEEIPFESLKETLLKGEKKNGRVLVSFS